MTPSTLANEHTPAHSAVAKKPKHNNDTKPPTNHTHFHPQNPQHRPETTPKPIAPMPTSETLSADALTVNNHTQEQPTESIERTNLTPPLFKTEPLPFANKSDVETASNLTQNQNTSLPPHTKVTAARQTLISEHFNRDNKTQHPDTDNIRVVRRTKNANATLVNRIFDNINMRSKKPIEHVVDLNAGEGGMTTITRHKHKVTSFDKHKNKTTDKEKHPNTFPSDILYDEDHPTFHRPFADAVVSDVPCTTQSAGHNLLNCNFHNSFNRLAFNNVCGVNCKHTDANIMSFFAEAFHTAQRILKHDGFLLVKCTDTKTRIYTIEIVCMGTRLFNFDHCGTCILAPTNTLLDLTTSSCSVMLVFQLQSTSSNKLTAAITPSLCASQDYDGDHSNTQLNRFRDSMCSILKQSTIDYQEKANMRDQAFKQLEMKHTVLLGWLVSKFDCREAFLNDARQQIGSKYFTQDAHFKKAYERFEQLKKNFAYLRQQTILNAIYGGIRFDEKTHWETNVPTNNNDIHHSDTIDYNNHNNNDNTDYNNHDHNNLTINIINNNNSNKQYNDHNSDIKNNPYKKFKTQTTPTTN